MTFYKILLLLPILLLSCKKNKKKQSDSEIMIEKGILIVNEGLFQQNNSSLTFVNVTKNTNDNIFFETNTGRGLGDTGNDIQRYGSKIYIVVNVSSTIEVLNAKTGKSIKKIAMTNSAGNAKQPRSITFVNGKAYVSCFDGYVDILDTSSLEVISRILVGKNPDQICSNGQYVFVSNSGGLDFPTLDSTVSVINCNTNSEEKKIVVGKNPGVLALDNAGFLHVSIRGDYGSVAPSFVKVNVTSSTIVTTNNWEISGIAARDGNFVLVKQTGSVQTVALYNPTSATFANSNFLSLAGITKLYNLQINPTTGFIYCTDAKNFSNTGEIFEFNSGGAYLRKWGTGINPGKMIFVE